MRRDVARHKAVASTGRGVSSIPVLMSVALGVTMSSISCKKEEFYCKERNVRVTLEEFGVVECDDPVGTTQPPFYEVEPGGDWNDQPEAGEAERRHVGGGLAVADVTGDGILDLVLPTYGGTQLYVGQTDGSYTNETLDRLPGTGPSSTATGAVAADYNGDGRLDLFITGYGEPDALWLNQEDGTFLDASDSAGVAGVDWFSVGGSWGDIDGDGDLDLFVSRQGDEQIIFDSLVYAQVLPCEGDPNGIYINNGDGTFEDQSHLVWNGIGEATFGGGWFDLDVDGFLDLYMVNDFGPHCGSNLVAWNTGEQLEVGPAPGLDLQAYSMGLGVGDVNNDLIPDLLVSSLNGVHPVESALDGSWYDSTLARGLGYDPDETGRHIGWGADLADLDNDGDLDGMVGFGYLYQTEEAVQAIFDTIGVADPHEQPDGVWQQSEEGEFEQVADSWGLANTGVSRGFVLADLNDDGWLDVVRRDLDGPATIHLAQCGSNAWLRVSLSQPGDNRFGVGARIEVATAAGKQTRTVAAGGTNFASAGPPEVHFGLGDAESVEELTVHWPDGISTVFELVSGSQQVRIVRHE